MEAADALQTILRAPAEMDTSIALQQIDVIEQVACVGRLVPRRPSIHRSVCSLEQSNIERPGLAILLEIPSQ